MWHARAMGMKARRARGPIGSITARAVTAGDWPHVEALFGPRGACAGCWCMFFRVPDRKAWEAGRGDGHKAALRRQVQKEEMHACLAFDGDEAVGWCMFGPRAEMPRLARSRAMQPVTDGGWVVPCFFVASTHRGRGVARALLDEVVTVARGLGAPALEGFPVRAEPGQRYAATFAYVGVPSLFAGAGFRDVTPAGATRPAFVRTLGRG